RAAFGFGSCLRRLEDARTTQGDAGSGHRLSGLLRPFFEDGLALLRGPFDGVFGAHRASRRLGHHVRDDEVVVDLISGGPWRSRIAGSGSPSVRTLQHGKLVVRR